MLAMVPLILFGEMTVVNPDYLPMLLDDPKGRTIVVFAFFWGSIGFYFIRRIIRIEV